MLRMGFSLSIQEHVQQDLLTDPAEENLLPHSQHRTPGELRGSLLICRAGIHIFGRHCYQLFNYLYIPTKLGTGHSRVSEEKPISTAQLLPKKKVWQRLEDYYLISAFQISGNASLWKNRTCAQHSSLKRV